MPSSARRVTLYRDHAGQFRYKVQSGNWRTIAAAEEGFTRKSTIVRRIARLYPGVEVIDNT